MKSIITSTFSKVAILTAIISVAFIANYLFAAWNAPPAGSPPDCPSGEQGCDAPLNVSATPQSKPGNLTLNGLSTLVLQVLGSAQIMDGTQATGSVLVSVDDQGNTEWRSTSSLGITGDGSGSGSGWEDVPLSDTGSFDEQCSYRVFMNANVGGTYEEYVGIDPVYYADSVTSNKLSFTHGARFYYINSDQKGDLKGNYSAGYYYDAEAVQVQSIQKNCGGSGSGSGSFSCPAGFTLVEGGGRTLGCLQNDEEGSGDYFTAANACFSNYGGRLPSHNEWYLGVSNNTLQNESGNYEWLDDLKTDGVGMVAGNSSIEDTDSPGLTNTGVYYRCFIPASGGGGGDSGGDSLPNQSGHAGEFLTTDGTTASWDSVTVAGGGIQFGNFFHIQDRKSPGTEGGSFPQGSWLTRDLNHEEYNTISGASLGVNQFTLPQGTYYIEADAPAKSVEVHKAKLRNVTDGTDVLIGTTHHADRGDGDSQSESRIIGIFTVDSSSETFEIQHRGGNGWSGDGFGRASDFGEPEIYTNVRIWQVN